MNTKLLQKAIDELKSDKPDLSYLRGMLETMMDMQEETHLIRPGQIIPNFDATGTIERNIATLSLAEQAAQAAEAGFIKGTKPGIDIPVINSGQ